MCDVQRFVPTGTVFYTVSIPRAQVAMAVGHAASSAKTFKLEAVRGSEMTGIHSPKDRRAYTEPACHAAPEPDGAARKSRRREPSTMMADVIDVTRHRE